jgi:hypothetical protein
MTWFFFFFFFFFFLAFGGLIFRFWGEPIASSNPCLTDHLLEVLQADHIKRFLFASSFSPLSSTKGSPVSPPSSTLS